MNRQPTVQDFVGLCFRFLAAELECGWLRPQPTKSGRAESVVAAVMTEPPKDSTLAEHKRVFERCRILARVEAERAMRETA